MSFIQIKNLCAGYAKTAVLTDVNLEIEKGEIIALIGPNGAGKSTLLKSMARLLPVISGEICFDEKNLNDYSYKEISQKMAVILTERTRTELMTCRDVVEMGRFPYTGQLGLLSEIDNKKVDDAIDAVNAADIRDRDFNKISDGQRQRVLLARAICQEPEIILLDEPTSFLDVKHKLEILSLLTKMARQKNITVIMALHEIDLAEKIADRIVTVSTDGTVQSGEVEDVFSEEGIRNLYEIDNGFFDPMFGSIEMKKPEGPPRVFVVAGGGGGIPVYRQLQKKNIPFATGILYENDVDCRLARLLAAEVITQKCTGEIDESALNAALDIMKSCEYVIDARGNLGGAAAINERLISIAVENNITWAR